MECPREEENEHDDGFEQSTLRNSSGETGYYTYNGKKLLSSVYSVDRIFFFNS